MLVKRAFIFANAFIGLLVGSGRMKVGIFVYPSPSLTLEAQATYICLQGKRTTRNVLSAAIVGRS